MPIRYRILEGEIDRNAVREIMQSTPPETAWGKFFHSEDHSDGPGSIQAAAEAPMKVTAHDGEAEVEQIRQLIVAGEMKPHDLVDPGDGWREARAYGPLSEVCAELDDRDRSRQRKILALLIVGAFALVLLVGLLSDSME